MKRLEIIQLRLVSNSSKGLVEDIRRSLDAEGEANWVRIYRHATVANDLGIHIHFEADGDESRASDLGLRLATALREHGMVEYTIWIEEQTEPKEVSPRKPSHLKPEQTPKQDKSRRQCPSGHLPSKSGRAVGSGHFTFKGQSISASRLRSIAAAGDNPIKEIIHPCIALSVIGTG